MRCSNAHPTLCVTHAEAQAEAERETSAHNFAIDLTPPSGEFRTATEVNHALGKVFLLLAQNRIPRRNAVALGYIAQLLLQTLPAVKAEQISGSYQAWRESLDPAPQEDEPDDETECNDETESEPQGNSAVARVFSASALADDEGPEAFPPGIADAGHVSHSAKAEPNREPSLGAPISRLASCTASESGPQARIRRPCSLGGRSFGSDIKDPEEKGASAPEAPALDVTQTLQPRHDHPVTPAPLGSEAAASKSPLDLDDEPEGTETAAQPPAKWCYRDPRGNSTATGQVQLTLL